MVTPIASLGEVQAYADVVGNEVVLKLLMAGTLAAMGSFTNRQLVSTAKIGVRDGNGNSRLQLTMYPITSINSLKIDGNVIPASSGSNSLGYYYSKGGRSLMLRGYTFTIGDRNVEIDYVGGYGDASGPGGADIQPWPDDLKLAFLATVTTWLRRRKFLGVSSKSLAGESVSGSDSGAGASGSPQPLPAEARLILENYVNVVPETTL